MQVLPAKNKTRRKLHRKAFERIKESRWETSYKYMWIKHPWNAGELGRIVCLNESTNSKT